jgi:predicted TIM-barrel fold metal-dependent hydrolase
MPPEELREMYDLYEFRVMFVTTFGGVMKKMGLKPEEAWKAAAFMNKGSVEAAIQEMDEIGVEYIFIDQMKGWSRRENKLWGDFSLETMAELIDKSNGRIKGGAGYNPFRIKESLEEIERAVKDFGFIYVWAHPITFGLAPNDKKMYPLYGKCLDLGIPCSMQVGHSAEPLPSEPGRPMYADEVALDFPDLTLILTHTGWPWINEWMSVVWKHPNVYGNIGAYFPKALDPSLVQFMDGRGRDKVLWATNGFGLTRCKTEFLELPIKDENKKKILRENALKVFKL